MKKYLVFVLAALLIFGLGSVALAAEDSDTVTVTVNSIETLVVPGTTTVTLEAVDTVDPTKYAQATATDDGGLEYSHNSATSKKITASAAAGGSNATNDITLTVAIGTETAGTIVSGGEGQSDIELWTGITAGSYTEDLAWTANATFATTLAGSYIFTVTFTTADAA